MVANSTDHYYLLVDHFDRAETYGHGVCVALVGTRT
jgi:hypothetical protein